MFDPIKGPANPYQGPAVGLGTEAGDTWHDAVRKVNDGFKNIVDWAEGLGDGGDAGKRIADLEEAVAAVQKRNDEIEAHMKALLTHFDTVLSAQAPVKEPVKPVVEAPQS